MINDLNRVTQIQDAIGGLTIFSYDTNGNLLTVTDAKNQTTSYTYDEMDRLKTRTDALSRTESYAYDKNGNLTTFTDRKSQTATFAYDALNRRTGATYPDATVSFGYDAIGRLTSVSDSVGGTITWTYDTVSGGHHPRVQETTTPGTFTPAASVSATLGPVSAAGTPALTTLPTLTITTVGGMTVPGSPGGAYATADLTLSAATTNPVTVTVSATNIPVGTIVTIRVLPEGEPMTPFSESAEHGHLCEFHRVGQRQLQVRQDQCAVRLCGLYPSRGRAAID